MRPKVASEAVMALVLAVVVIAAAAVVGSERTVEDLRSSTYVDARRGAHALYLVLEQAGVPVSRQVDPPAATSPTDRTHVLLAPSLPPGRAAAQELLAWTAAGGRLVVVAAPTADVGPLLRPLGLETRPSSGADRRVSVPDAPWSAETRHAGWPARQVLGPAGEAAAAWLDERAGEPVPVVEGSEGTLVFRVPFGDGEVVAVADESLFVNESLRRGDDAVLAARLLAVEGRPVVFDEYHHGFAPDGGPAGLVSRASALLVTTWAGRALLVLLAAGLVYATGAAVRLGAPLPRPLPPRRALREHVDALGRLLEIARASPEALGILVDGVRRTVASRIGLAPAASSAALEERLRRSIAPGAGDLATAVAAARAAAARGGMKDVEFARLAANLAAARRKLLHGSE